MSKHQLTGRRVRQYQMTLSPLTFADILHPYVSPSLNGDASTHLPARPSSRECYDHYLH